MTDLLRIAFAPYVILFCGIAWALTTREGSLAYGKR